MYKKRVYRKRRGYKKKVVHKKPSKSLVKTIHKVINKEAETKYVNATGQKQAINTYNSSTNVYPVFNITPSITQGTLEGNRVGNVIHTTKVLFKYRIYSTLLSPATNYLCRVVIARNKTSLVAPTSWVDIFRNGAQYSAPGGNDLDQSYKLNNSNWVIAYDKQHKVSPSTNQTNLALNNNDFNFSCQAVVNLQRHYGKIVFPDSATTNVTKGWYMFVIPSDAQGATASGTGTATGLYITYETQMYFKDV